MAEEIKSFDIPPYTELLSICCTFRRPAMLKNMIESYYKTRSSTSRLIIYLHDDDPFLNEYLPIIENENYIIGQHRNLQQAINYVVFDVLPKIPYYQIICDDHIYHTPEWDKILLSAFKEKANGWGFVCGKDLSNGDDWEKCKHPSAEIWSWKMANTLGYVYPRNMEALHLDFYTKALGLAIDGLVFVPEVIIEHLWYGGCTKPPDQNILDKYNDTCIKKSDAMFDQWKDKEMKAAVDKINIEKIKEQK